MNIHLDCIPCFVCQAVDTTKVLNVKDETSQTLLRQILGLLQRLDWSLPPPIIGGLIHRAIRQTLNDPDPYVHQKVRDTERALALLPEVDAAIADSDDPFVTAVKFSIAGNAIDLGAKTGVDVDIRRTFRNALVKAVDQAAVEHLEKEISTARSVLFLADNAGEIVFDIPLLEQIGYQKVTIAVRGSPVINDATVDDAKRSGLTDRFRVISNGSDLPGTWLPECSREFVQEFDSADLVIAKGQGNFESLSDQSRSIIFLFLAKCHLVSQELGVMPGSFVIRTGGKKRTTIQNDQGMSPPGDSLKGK